MRNLWLRLGTLHRSTLRLLLRWRTRYRFTALLRRTVRDLRLRPLLLTALHLRLALLLLRPVLGLGGGAILLLSALLLRDGSVLLLRALLLGSSVVLLRALLLRACL